MSKIISRICLPVVVDIIVVCPGVGASVVDVVGSAVDGSGVDVVGFGCGFGFGFGFGVDVVGSGVDDSVLNVVGFGVDCSCLDVVGSGVNGDVVVVTAERVFGLYVG